MNFFEYFGIPDLYVAVQNIGWGGKFHKNVRLVKDSLVKDRLNWSVAIFVEDFEDCPFRGNVLSSVRAEEPIIMRENLSFFVKLYFHCGWIPPPTFFPQTKYAFCA